MKHVFLFIWLICMLLFGGFCILFAVREPSAEAGIALTVVIFYSTCLYMLINAIYSQEQILDDHRKGYWISWLPLPVALFMTNNGINVILSNSYQPSTSGRRRIISSFMNALTESFGPWLPGSLMMIFGLVASACSLYGVYRFSRN